MLNWGGKNWRPGPPSNRRQPINQSIQELMKPLGEKTFQGNVWGSIIMNVPEPTQTPNYVGAACIGTTAYDACNCLLYGGTYTGDSSTFCNSNTFTSNDLIGFGLSTGSYYLYDQLGNTGVKLVDYVSGNTFLTYNGNCQPCPYVRFVLNGVSDVAQNEIPTYYSFDGVTFSATTTSSRNLSNINSLVQYNEETGYWSAFSDGPVSYLDYSTDGITFTTTSYVDNPAVSMAKGLSGYNFSFGNNVNGPDIPQVNNLNAVTSYQTILGSCGSGPVASIFVDFGSSNVMWLAGVAGCTGDAYAINQNSDPTVDAWSAQTNLNGYCSPRQFASDYNSGTTQDTRVVAVGSQSILGTLAAVTTDGINWTGETSGLASEFNFLNCIIWDGTKFIAGGEVSVMSSTLPLFATSTDGISWTINTGSTFTTLGVDIISDISFDGTTYIAIGINNISVTSKIFSSPDGETWTDLGVTFPSGAVMYKVDSNPHPYKR